MNTRHTHINKHKGNSEGAGEVVKEDSTGPGRGKMAQEGLPKERTFKQNQKDKKRSRQSSNLPLYPCPSQEHPLALAGWLNGWSTILYSPVGAQTGGN